MMMMMLKEQMVKYKIMNSIIKPNIIPQDESNKKWCVLKVSKIFGGSSEISIASFNL